MPGATRRTVVGTCRFADPHTGRTVITEHETTFEVVMHDDGTIELTGDSPWWRMDIELPGDPLPHHGRHVAARTCDV